MSWLNDLLNGANQAVDVYAKVQTIKNQVRPPRRAPVRRRPVPQVVAPAPTPKKSLIEQNQTQLLLVAGLLAVLLVVRKQ